MAEQLQPSPPGPDFSSADVQRAFIGPEDAGRIILQYLQQGARETQAREGGIDTPTALLAAILRSQATGTVRFQITTYSLVGGAGFGQLQQAVVENPLRKALILASLSGTSFFLFESGPPVPQNIVTADFDVKRKTALSSGFNNPHNLFPAPINPITAIVAPATSANGIIIEGI